ncbi:MAG: 50S ribosomal protein L4 [Candidatus Aminicenantales bacterium]
MGKLQVFDQAGNPANEMELADSVFAYPDKGHLVYEAVVNYRANQRQGTAATKTRAEVSGGGRKPWRQKGTGRARAGSTRSPLWRKGGTTFGPQPRDYSYELPKKARRNALRSVLSRKLTDSLILVLREIEIKEPKTKEAAALLKAFHINSALLVDSHENTNLFLSVRNLPKIKAVDVRTLNVYDVLNYKWLVFSQRALESAMERLK